MDQNNKKDQPGILGPLPPNGRRLFLADLHLDGTDCAHALTFRAVLKGLAQNVEQTPTDLFILGDLFDLWEEYHPQVAARYEKDLQALEEASKAGVRIHLLFGNRDFTYGSVIKKRINAIILGDDAIVTLSDERKVWIEHGDLLCTDDVRYLRFRKWVRSGFIKFIYRMLPWSLAKKMAGDISARSEKDKAKKAPTAFDINLEAARIKAENKGCYLLMCGHTHKPQATDLGGGFRIIVLPAWCDICSGYRDRGGSLVPVHFEADGSPGPADATGQPK